MKVIVYHPKDPKAIHALQKKVATAHAEMVLRYVSKMIYPKNEKLKLLNVIIKTGSR